jgi:hypothetical protein
MATTTNFGFETPDDTDLVKDGALAIRTALDDVDERFGDDANYPDQIVNVVSGVSRPLPFAMQAGQAVITGSATVTWADATRFTQTPLLQVSVVNGNNTRTKVVASSVTSTSFTLAVYASGTTLSSTAAAIDYLGIQMTSAASAG